MTRFLGMKIYRNKTEKLKLKILSKMRSECFGIETVAAIKIISKIQLLTMLAYVPCHMEQSSFKIQ
jgi:hypothetical protein